MEIFINKDLERKLSLDTKRRIEKIVAEIEELENETANEYGLLLSGLLILISPKNTDIYDDELAIQEENGGYSDPCLFCSCQGELCDCGGCVISNGRNICSNCE